MKHTITKTILLAASLLIFQSSDSWAMAKKPPTSSKPPTTTPAPTPTPDPKPPVDTTPIDDALRDVVPLWESKVSGSKAWSDHVYAELDVIGQDLVDVIPADKSLFCPNYANLSYSQRKQYWAFMLSAMARFESNFKPETSYTESFEDANGNRVVSRGLLQISIESGNSYGCGLKKASELHDPKVNLSCGIRILNRWLGRDGRIAGKVSGAWKGGARYWSVLREGDKTSYKSIVSWSQNLSICKKN